ncbi:hypothetical protein L3V82_00550 [Thiotrichales bacterium 19S3-7]|nr:hypothetical protein [Thiotrichales bacterium 19S3-7]MCF6800653.1 hypothetical protein [Thiotrichales bacterium 19S3-11]
MHRAQLIKTIKIGLIILFCSVITACYDDSVSIDGDGHFNFSEESLNLYPKQTGTVTLSNTGSKDITDFSLTIPEEFNAYITSNTCASTTTLLVNKQCNFSYDTASAKSNFTGNITASGNSNSVDNTPLKLPVNLATSGHFTFSPQQLTLYPNQTGTVTLSNTGGEDIESFKLTIPEELSGYISDNSCTATTLDSNTHCSFNYDTNGAKSKYSGNITASGDSNTVDNTPLNLAVELNKEGHFSFSPDKLNLFPYQTGTVTLKNTGEETISDFKLTIPEAFTQYIQSNTCQDITSLAKNTSCSIDYDTSEATESYTGYITATGNTQNVDNTPETLPIHLAKLGHFVFSETELNLYPNESGTVVVSNSGEETITSFKLAIPSEFQQYITENDCADINTISVNDSCSFKYNTTGATSDFNGNISVSGDSKTVDNTPLNLPVTLAKSGHFVFDPKQLNATKGQTGVVTLTNTGEQTITGFQLVIPDNLSSYITNNDCNQSQEELKAKASCSFKYDTTNLTETIKDNITANGNSNTVNNTPTTLETNFIIKGNFTFSESALDITNESSGTVTLKNDGGYTITDFKLTIPDGFNQYITQNTCQEKSELNVNTSCYFDYNTTQATEAFTGTITAEGNPQTVDNTPESLAVDLSILGDFVFNPSSLKLINNNTGSVILENKGGTTIDQVDLNIPKDLLPFITSNSCQGISSLKANASCSFSYDTTGASSTYQGNIVATGDTSTVDNSPHNLPVSLTTGGLFIFIKGDNSKASEPTNDGIINESTTFTLKNIGDTTITDFSLSFSDSLSQYVTKNNCQTLKELKANQSCSITLTSSGSKDKETGQITAQGNPDVTLNSPHTLNTRFITNLCDSAYDFAKDRSTNNSASATCYDFHKKPPDITAICGKQYSGSEHTSASCSDIVHNNQYGPYELINHDGKLLTNTQCSRSVVNFAQKESTYNPSPKTCYHYDIPHGYSKYLGAECKDDHHQYKYSETSCYDIFNRNMSETFKLINDNGELNTKGD